MKVHDCEQGTTHWLDLRAGIPTASCFDQIITPKTRKPATNPAIKYRYKLLAERLVGHSLIGYQSISMERGKSLEVNAVEFYEFSHDVDTVKVGFVTNDEGTVGASPDRLVGEDGLLETKCPEAHTQVGYLLGKSVDEEYYQQVQGQLWITGRKWVDVLAYHPELPPALIRVERNEKYIKETAGAVLSFSMELEAAWVKLEAEYKPRDEIYD